VLSKDFLVATAIFLLRKYVSVIDQQVTSVEGDGARHENCRKHGKHAWEPMQASEEPDQMKIKVFYK